MIRRFFKQLPGWVDAPTREQADVDLARIGTQQRPEQLAKFADRLTDFLNPDGTYTDEDRARRRCLTLGKQHADGMSELRGWVSPELRAALEAMLAKLAAPGMCNPDDDTAVLDGAPSQDGIDRDSRTPAQRNHDGLNAALRAILASGELGQHNGLPAAIVVTTTLADLEAAAGKALTGGGTLLPMSDVIRMARHAHHYLAIFDNGKALALYHTKRLASPGQRIVLYSKDRGCTAPGCDVPGYLCEVHHVTDYATCRSTTPTTSPSPAGHTTACCNPAAGSPAKTPAATPNGSHPHTSNATNPAPTPSTTPKNCSAKTTRTTRSPGPERHRRRCVTGT